MDSFWNTVNSDLGFVFVAGVPSNNFKDLLNSMDSELMHFVPTVDEETALGLATGSFISGLKSFVFIESDRLFIIANQFKKINKEYSLPIIFLIDKSIDFMDLKTFSYENSWKTIDNYVYTNNKSTMVIL